MSNFRSKWRYIGAFIRSMPAVILYRLFRIKPHYDRIGNIRHITFSESDEVIKNAIQGNQPFAAIRFGGTELSAINNYEKIRLGFKRGYKRKVKKSMKINGGFFPTTKEQLNYYGKYLQEHLSEADILGISGLHMEDYYHRNFTPTATPIQNWALDPLLGSWSPLLKGKKVLVISPFADQIESQYRKRLKLFPENSNILPEMKLITIKMVLSNGSSHPKDYGSWFEVLDKMKLEILKKDFDIALVGAGTYGTPLCLFIKELGKKAIQSGGATQLLFGIIGKRWENRLPIKEYRNQYWVRPNLKPEGYEKIEKGCYW